MPKGAGGPSATDTLAERASPGRMTLRSCNAEGGAAGGADSSEHRKKASLPGKPLRNLCSGTVVWVKRAGFPWWPCVVFRSWAAWQRFGLPWPRPETTDELKKRAASSDYASGLCKKTQLPLPAPGFCIVHFLGPLLSCEYCVHMQSNRMLQALD